MQALPEFLRLQSLESIIDYSPLIVVPETPLMDAIALMAEQGKSVLVGSALQIVGYFTKMDIVQLVVSGTDLTKVKISELMRTPVMVLKLSECHDLATAASLLCQYELSLVPVANDQGHIIGIISSASICQALGFGTNTDIDDRVAAEVALRESERRYQTIAKISPVVIFRTDTFGNGLYVNDRWCEMTGLTKEEALGSGWLDAIHPEDQPRIRAQWSEVMTQKLPFSSEYRFRRSDGTISWVFTQAVPEADDSGEVVAYVGTITDISEQQAALHKRELAEEALKHSKERFRNLVEASSDWVWEVDQNSSYIYVSPQIKDILGYEPQEILGKTPFDLMSREEAERVNHVFVSAAQTQQPFKCLENINLHKDGHPVVLETSGVPVFNIEGKFCGYRGIDRDITTRKQAEAALRETQEQLQGILDNSPAVIYVVDTQNRFLLVNRQYQKLFNITQDQIAGKSIYDNWSYNIASVFAANNKKVITDGLPVEAEEVVPHQDGLHTYLSVKFPLKDANGITYAVGGISTDITYRKLVEESLLRFRKAIESTSDAIGMANITGEAIYVNPAFIELFEYTLVQLQAAGGSPIIFQQQAECQTILANIQQDESWRGEVAMQTRSGRSVQIYLRADAIKDATGTIVGTVSIYTDITQLKQAEESLRLRDRAIAASSNGIVIADVTMPGEPIIYVNPAFERMSGYCAAEAIGQNFRLRQGSDIKQPGLEELSTAMQQGKDCTVILHNYRKDGSLFWNELNISPVSDNDGYLTHYIGIQTDITARKQAETALLVSQQRLQYLLSSSPAVIYTCKSSGDFGSKFVSENINAMMGYEAQEWLSNSGFWSNHLHPEDLPRVFAELSKILDKDNYTLEYRFLHQDGLYRWVYDQGKVVRDEAGNPVELVGYLADITDRKQLEQELRIALEKEKELSELKSRFVSMTSHEFRTPLSTILSSCELLEHYRHKWTQEKQLIHLQRIQTAVRRMTGMLNDVLIIGKVEAGKLEYRPTSFNLVEYCQQLVEEVQLNLRNQRVISFSSQYESVPCYMDDKLLEHILSNLLLNAIKYSPSDSTVKFNLNCQDKLVVFEVQDRGIGVPEEDIPHLFESFHRARNVGNILGTGLGLAIVKKCVDIHQGQIFVTSTLGFGTKFIVKLPLNNQI